MTNTYCEEENDTKEAGKNDKPEIAFNILALIFPLVGLIVYLLYHKKAPIMAKSVAKWAVIGVFLDIFVDGGLIALFWNS